MKKSPVLPIAQRFVKEYRTFIRPVTEDLQKSIHSLKHPRNVEKLVRAAFKRHHTQAFFKHSLLKGIDEAWSKSL